MKRIIVIVCLFITCFSGAFAQSSLLKRADKEFESFNYSVAIPLYLEAYQTKNTLHAAERLAYSYYQVRNFKEAENWYGRLANSDQSTPEFVFHYANALKNNSKFREAKSQYNRLENMGDRTVSLGDLEKLIRSCDSAILWMEKPNVLHEINNFRSVNTTYNEFSPVQYHDNLLITSDRLTGDADVNIYGWTGNPYLRLFEYDGNSTLPKNISWFNRNHHFGSVTLSPRNNEVYFSVTRNLTSKEKSKSKGLKEVNIEIFSNNLQSEDWGKDAKSFKLNNITEYSVGDPYLTHSGDTLYFTSDMPGGFGGTDIYYVVKENGNWSNPINAGANINTAFDERFPSQDGKGNFYFSSEGHVGMGGLDLYTIQNKNGVNVALNLGYPINSPADDFSIHFTSDYEGYLASNRNGGMGGDDIYDFKIKREVVLDVKGRVLNAQNNMPIQNSQVTLFNKSDNEEVEIYSSREGNFHFNLKANKDYTLSANSVGYQSFKPLEFNTRNYEESTTLEKNILLEPVKEEEVVVLRNIYFDFDKYDIRPDAALELTKVLAFLESNPEASIELSAHTDSRGSANYNMTLSQKRAEAAVEFLVAAGISRDRLQAKGYGFTRLANHCAPGVECTDEEHEFNRRVEFFIIKK